MGQFGSGRVFNDRARVPLRGDPHSNLGIGRNLSNMRLIESSLYQLARQLVGLQSLWNRRREPALTAVLRGGAQFNISHDVPFVAISHVRLQRATVFAQELQAPRTQQRVVQITTPRTR